MKGLGGAYWTACTRNPSTYKTYTYQSCVHAPASVRSVLARVNSCACVTRCADACAYARLCAFSHMRLNVFVYVHMHRVSCCPDCDNEQPGFPVPSVMMRNVWQQETPKHLPHGDLRNFSPGNGIRNIAEAKYDRQGTSNMSVLHYEHAAFAWDEHTTIWAYSVCVGWEWKRQWTRNMSVLQLHYDHSKSDTIIIVEVAKLSSKQQAWSRKNDPTILS